MSSFATGEVTTTNRQEAILRYKTKQREWKSYTVSILYAYIYQNAINNLNNSILRKKQTDIWQLDASLDNRQIDTVALTRGM